MPRIVPIPAVNAVMINPQGLILLTERSLTVREPGKWCLPGGHLDGGESWEQAIHREIKEEVGVDIVSAELIGIYSDPELTRTSFLIDEDYYGQFVVASFLVTQWHGEITPNDEVGKWDFFKSDELPSPIIRSHPIRIEDAIAFKGKAFVR